MPRILQKINQFADELKDVVTKIEEAIWAVDGKADTNEAASRLGSLAHEQNDSIRKLQVTLESMTGAVTELADHAVQLNGEVLQANALQAIESVAADMEKRTGEQSSNTGSILGDCDRLMEIAEQFNNEGSEVENSGKELKDLSRKLSETVERFRL